MQAARNGPSATPLCPPNVFPRLLAEQAAEQMEEQAGG